MNEEKIIKRAEGTNGQLVLLDNKIRIERKGSTAFWTQGLKGDKEIFIRNISSIQLKKCGTFTAGFIQFSFIGGTESKKGLFAAVEDENTVMFNNNTQDDFIKIKQLIEDKMSELSDSSHPRSNLDELEKLAELKEKGIITEEEFSAKKKQILGL